MSLCHRSAFRWPPRTCPPARSPGRRRAGQRKKRPRRRPMQNIQQISVYNKYTFGKCETMCKEFSIANRYHESLPSRVSNGCETMSREPGRMIGRPGRSPGPTTKSQRGAATPLAVARSRPARTTTPGGRSAGNYDGTNCFYCLSL